MAGYEALTDERLLSATVAGDASAFAAFYRRYEHSLLGWLRARAGDPELAADLAAEVFARVLEAADRFDARRAGGSSAGGWLFAIAHNTLSTALQRGRVAEDARRRLQMREPLVLVDDDLDRISVIGDDEPVVRRLLADLPEEQREAILARVVEELDYEQIAAAFNCSALVVRKRVSRGLAAMRAELKEIT